jgi:hypothetical protein
VVSDDSDRNFDGNGPRTGVVVTFQVGVVGAAPFDKQCEAYRATIRNPNKGMDLDNPIDIGC